MRLICENAARAQSATIQEYNSYMIGRQDAGPDSIRSVLTMDPALKKQIEGFDRSTLRHVVPPR
jgi:hypothetical protein